MAIFHFFKSDTYGGEPSKSDTYCSIVILRPNESAPGAKLGEKRMEVGRVRPIYDHYSYARTYMLHDKCQQFE